MNRSSLPPPEELHLIQADGKQTLKARQNTFPHWARNYTLDQFLDREETLARAEFAKDNMITWILVDKRNPSELYGHCETFKRKAFYQGGEIVCFSVASVFVPEKYRKRGYGSRMIQCLSETLSQHGNSCSNLYSDVGVHFYSRHGWKVYPNDTLVIHVDEVLPFDINAIEHLLTIDHSNIDVIAEVDYASIKQKMATAVGKGEMFQIIPSSACYRWHWERSLHEALHSNKPIPTHFGAYEKSPKSGNFIIWQMDYYQSKLYVLRLAVQDFSVLEQLLLKSICVARAHCLRKIEIWDVSRFPVELLNKYGKVVQREESHSSLNMLSSEKDESVFWVGNEKYSWV